VLEFVYAIVLIKWFGNFYRRDHSSSHKTEIVETTTELMKKINHVSVDTNKLERTYESRSINCFLSPMSVQFTGFLKDYSS
jgi:hypothetical protein